MDRETELRDRAWQERRAAETRAMLATAAPHVVWLVIVEWSTLGGDPDVRGAYTTEDAAERAAEIVTAELTAEQHDVWRGDNPDWQCAVHVLRQEVTQ